MTETGKIMQAVDAVEHDLKHCGYLRKEATEQYLPTLITAAKAQFAEARLLDDTDRINWLSGNGRVAKFADGWNAWTHCGKGSASIDKDIRKAIDGAMQGVI